MILVQAVVAGFLAGQIRAWYGGRRLSAPDLRCACLVLLAFIPQWLAFFLPASRNLVPDRLAPAVLVGSQALLLLFAWLNRDRPGFRALGLGLALNLLVITLNGGLMPISPETLARLVPEIPESWQVGGRLGSSKSILLPTTATHLAWLSDRFLPPSWFPNRMAFSLGDAFIAGGAFFLLWVSGGEQRATSSVTPMNTPMNTLKSSEQRDDCRTRRPLTLERIRSISRGYFIRG